MAQYSSYRVYGTAALKSEPTATVQTKPTEAKRVSPKTGMVQTAAPGALLGFGLAAALTVLLLLSQARLSAMSFEIDSLERQIAQLELQQDKLLIRHARAYGLDRIEDYATRELGMVKPNPDQIYTIETGSYSRTEQKAAP